MTTDEAYATQLAMLDERVGGGEVQAGWKVGATALAVLRQRGLDLTEPLFGYLLASRAFASGAVFRCAEMVSPGFENELCFTFGSDLRGPGVTFEQALSAIDFVQPAIEVVEKRRDVSLDINAVVADNLEQYAYVLGVEVPMPTAIPLNEVSLEAIINGEIFDQASGAEVLGHPVASVVWLANKLSAYGRCIESGMRVMSGSFTRQGELHAGDEIEARFDGIGTARLSVV